MTALKRLLALETSTERASAALRVGEKMYYLEADIQLPSTQTMLPLITQILDEAGVVPADLDGVAFGEGPGAFTGLRVACAMAQGIALAADCPVFPVSTLAALAWQAWQDDCEQGHPRGDGPLRIVSVLDARMSEVYVDLFEVDANGVSPLREHPMLVSPAALPDLTAGVWHVTGTGLETYPEIAQRWGHWRFQPRWPQASDMADLAWTRLIEGGGLDPALAQPVYVRNKVAQTTAERLANGGKA